MWLAKSGGLTISFQPHSPVIFLGRSRTIGEHTGFVSFGLCLDRFEEALASEPACYYARRLIP